MRLHWSEYPQGRRTLWPKLDILSQTLPCRSQSQLTRRVKSPLGSQWLGICNTWSPHNAECEAWPLLRLPLNSGAPVFADSEPRGGWFGPLGELGPRPPTNG
eukprot:2047965-Alexandrium_andersonii.AAC.1